MLCNNHPTGMGATIRQAGKPCTECGAMACSDYLICVSCSDSLDECEEYRAPLDKGTDKRRITAFRSPAAQLLRKARLQAHEDFRAKNAKAQETLAAQTAAPAQLLRNQIEPFKQAHIAACKPFCDALQAVTDQLIVERDSFRLSWEQSVAHSERHNEAMQICSAGCAPFDEEYKAATEGFTEAYRQAIGPATLIASEAIRTNKVEFDARLVELDSQMQQLLARATSRRYIAIDALATFCKRLMGSS